MWDVTSFYKLILFISAVKKKLDWCKGKGRETKTSTLVIFPLASKRLAQGSKTNSQSSIRAFPLSKWLNPMPFIRK